MDIVVDFDGTCVTHEYPRVGRFIGSAPILRALVKNGHRLILSTMRSNKPFKRADGSLDKSGLDDAVDWFRKNGIELFGIQKNPEQGLWTDSPKAYGQLHIDDASLGCPLMRDKERSDRPFVNWFEVGRMLTDMGLITKDDILNQQVFVLDAE